MIRRPANFILSLGLLFLWACPETPPAYRFDKPSQAILLVTLDTTRADRLGQGDEGSATPNLDALARRGMFFTRAYTTVPATLPAHTSILSGTLPVDHTIHENGRYLPPDLKLIAPQLKEAGYQTAAFVSAYPLAARFGLARGFDVYVDPGKRPEKTATETTDDALRYLEAQKGDKLFLWVHYFDPHHPYQPPEPFKSRFADDPYTGEIAYMDREFGRLLAAFEKKFAEVDHHLIVVADHGEGLGEHGERFHGHLLYEGTMKVPLILAGTRLSPSVEEVQVSTMRVRDTIAQFAGQEGSQSLFHSLNHFIFMEAMKPFMQYGWSPQIAMLDGEIKYIRSTDMEIYDLAADPKESNNLAGSFKGNPMISRRMAAFGLPYQSGNNQELSYEERSIFASLGYFTDGAPLKTPRPWLKPADQIELLTQLDQASSLFVGEQYPEAIRVMEQILITDPENRSVLLRLGVAHSLLGREQEALRYFNRVAALAPESVDLRHYVGLHHFRFGQWERAATHLEWVLDRWPDKVEALECLAQIREKTGDSAGALAFYERAAHLKRDPALYIRKGLLCMQNRMTIDAIEAFREAERLAPAEFTHHLELGVCYFSISDYRNARQMLDLVPPDHPGYAMARFKRAQVSVLLKEADAHDQVREALAAANPQTAELIRNDDLLRPYLP